MKKPLVGIIGGEGKMGKWFRRFFKKQRLRCIISDENTKLSNIELTKAADIVIIAVPIKETEKVIKEIRSYVKKDALLTDLASIKTAPLQEMKKAKCGVLGMHPLFGPMVPNLKNQTIVFCRQKDNQWVIFLKKIFQKNRAKIIETSPEKHDKQVAFIQALTHLNNICLAHFLYLNKFKSFSYFLTPAFKLQGLVIGRVLSQSPELYASIEMENPLFEKILDEYAKHFSEFKKIIKEKDYSEFKKRFKKSTLYFSDFMKIAEEKNPSILKKNQSKQYS